MTEAQFKVHLLRVQEKRITKITVSTPLSTDQLSQFCITLNQAPHITSLIFTKAAALGDGGVTTLVAGLLGNRTLRNLSLNDNHIGDPGAYHLSKLLHSAHSGLMTLKVNHNNISHVGASFIAERLKGNARLIGLAMAYNQMGEQGAIALGSMLYRNKRLRWLNIGHNDIGEIGMGAITLGSSRNNHLKHLCIAGNPKIAPKFGEFITMLKINQTLESLNGSHNNLENDAAFTPAEILTENQGLQRLIISDNGIKDRGVSASSSVSAAASSSETLTRRVGYTDFALSAPSASSSQPQPSITQAIAAAMGTLHFYHTVVDRDLQSHQAATVPVKVQQAEAQAQKKSPGSKINKSLSRGVF